MTKVNMLKSFVDRNASSGELTSYMKGHVYNLADEKASSLVSGGFAELYTLITPTGKKNITGTSEVDVTAYAKAQVVDENLIAGNIKKDVTILGVTGTYEA